jgi:hypothetical protein
MFVPITSEITIKVGMVLKEIATERLFRVDARLTNGNEVWGEDSWRIIKTFPADLDRIAFELTRQELSMKYFAEVDD